MYIYKYEKSILDLSIILFLVTYFIQKSIFLSYISCFALILIATRTINIKNAINIKKLLGNKILIFTILLVFIELFMSLLSHDVKDAINQWRKDYLLVFLFGFSIVTMTTRLTLFDIFRNMIISLLLINFYFIWETYQYNKNLNIFLPSFITPRDSTLIIPILLPFALYGCILYFKDKLFILISILAIIFSLLLTFFSGSRGAMITFVLELSIFLFYILYFLIKKGNYQLIIFIFFGLLFLTNIINFENKHLNDAFARGFFPNGRDTIIQSWLPVIKNNLWTGIGLGNSNAAYELSQHNIQNIYVVTNQQGQLQMGAHNRFISILLESGIFALSIYVTIIFFTLKQLLSFKQHIFNIYNIYALTFITILIEHFIIRGMVESLKFSSFYLIIFFIIMLSYKFEKEENENSLHLS